MAVEVHTILAELGYKCELCPSSEALRSLVENEVGLPYAEMVHWLSLELQRICKLEECVHKVDSNEDLGSFYVELNSFLRELKCPYSSLICGNLSKNLSSKEQRLQLLNYLVTELQAACMISAKTDKVSAASEKTSQLAESETAAVLRNMLTSLGLGKPPPNITPQQLFARVFEKVKAHLSNAPKCLVGDSLFTGVLSEKQWQMLQKINEAMTDEYKSREDVLLKRLDVTIQSFTWSERIKKMEEKLIEIYQPTRRKLKLKSRIQMSDLLAARTDLLEIDKTSGVSVRSKTRSKLNSIIMKGRVPDRGGRPTEIEPPPPEMPPWQQRSAGGSGGGYQQPQGQRQADGRGGRGGGGGRGGRVQSNWNSGSGDSWGQQPQSGSGHGYGQQQPGGGGYFGGQQQQQQPQAAYGYQQPLQQQPSYYGQQQGAAYYQDFYNTGRGGGGQQQPNYNDYGDPRQGGSRGGRGGGGRYR